jgi:hypothetical protein
VKAYKYIVKLFSPWHTVDLIYHDVCFAPNVELSNADGALWEYWPNEVILKYNGPKAWYSWEPGWHSQYRSQLVRRVRSRLNESEWLHYAHNDPQFRIPHITNCGPMECRLNDSRSEAAVAIVSNAGGRMPFLRSGLRLRNKFVVHPAVELYGRRQGWQSFRKYGIFSSPGLPANYRGELNWSNGWMADEQIHFMSQYRVAVCLENSIEPFYFTEKFVNAVRAGCVPVYHAHSTVKHGILTGARWIDPAEYGYDVSKTIKAALAAPLSFIQQANQAWLNSLQVRKTHFEGVWSQLALIFEQKIRSAQK